MQLIKRRALALWTMAAAAIAAAQEPVVITAGQSTFGPPTGVPPPLNNGQCPSCRHQNHETDFPLEHYPGVIRYSAKGAPPEILVGCAKCKAAFWQQMKGQ